MDSDVIVVGAGLSGLVAARELVAADRSVIVQDAEPLSSVGGQAHWSRRTVHGEHSSGGLSTREISAKAAPTR